MYNFKKNAKLYIVELNSSGVATNKHSIDIYSDVNASQTFDEQSYKRKTLHSQLDLHEHAVINKANVANFSFTTPIPNITTVPIVLKLGREYSTITDFDIYIQSDNIIYKLEKCTIESLAFNIEMKSVLTISVSGTASKLAKYVGSIPGTTVTPIYSAGDKYGSIDRMNVTIGGSVLDSIAAINMDLKNEISWTSYTTVNQAVQGTMMYPESYVLQGRTLSGSITQFLTSANVDTIADTSTNSPIVISIYNGSNTLLEFNLSSTVFTRRLNFEELINRVYDFRLNSNTITNTIKYKGV